MWIWLLLCASLPPILSKEYGRHHHGKIRCFSCNMPYHCESGSCYGDICVKTSASDRYVVKGCENVSRSSVTSDIYDPHMKQKSYCRSEFLFGIEATICYCRDGDFCNSTSIFSLFTSLLSIILIHVIL